MADVGADKFRLSEEQKRRIKDAFSDLVDRHFDILESSYADIFRGIPGNVAESMSPQDSARLVDMVVREAASSISKGASMVQKEVARVAKDDERMAAIRKEFLGSLGLKETKE